MIRGEFVGGNKPLVPATLIWNDATQGISCILDTGSTADMVISPEVADALGIEITAMNPVTLAGNTTVSMPMGTAIAVIGTESLYVTAYIADGWPLLGIGFLQKFGLKAIVDCKNKEVFLEAAA